MSTHQITCGDRFRCRDQEWLNDSVINLYQDWHRQTNPDPHVISFNTFFVANLETADETVRAAKKRDKSRVEQREFKQLCRRLDSGKGMTPETIFASRVVTLTVNVSRKHWALVVVANLDQITVENPTYIPTIFWVDAGPIYTDIYDPTHFVDLVKKFLVRLWKHEHPSKKVPQKL